jgi:hypothetical protein
MYNIQKILLLFLVLIFPWENMFSQCAMCKAVVENGDQAMAEGINSGITYLMAFPYILVAGLFFLIYRFNRKLKE